MALHVVSRLRTRVAVGAILLGVVPGIAWTAMPEIQREINRGEELTGDFLISPDNKRIPVRERNLGTPIDEHILLMNRTQSEQTIDLQLGQIVGSADPERGFEIRHGVLQGAAAWVELGASSVTVRPRETVRVPMIITIPKDATAGDKAFTVSATQRGGAVAAAGAQPRFRLTTVFALELPGDAVARVEAPDGSIRNSVWIRGAEDPPAALITYENTGERFVRPEGTITVNPVFGPSYRYTVDPFTVYPDGSKTQLVQLDKLPAFGFASVTAKIDNDIEVDTFKLGNLWILPSWWKWAAAAIGLLLIWMVYRAIRWWRRRGEPAWVAFVEDPDDDELDPDDPLAGIDAETSR